MKALLGSLILTLAGCASVQPDDVRVVSPALDRYTRGALLGELWQQPDLSPRDRSLVTVSALIARNQTVDEPFYFDLALEKA